MSGDWLDQLLAEELSRRSANHLHRSRQAVSIIDSTHVEIEGRRYVNFSSNNYLGLTHHPRVLAAMHEALDASGAGAGASGLVSGYSTAHAEAEAALAQWKGSQAAVILPSGYQAAHAVVQTIAGAGDVYPGGVRFLIDKLAHASLIDAVTASGKPFRVLPHNGLSKLERLLHDSPREQVQVVVTESIFSMDGDAADLAGLVELKRRLPFVLVLDEAHGSGVYGRGGAGYAAETGVSGDVDMSIVTLSKAVGVVGGAVCASRAFCDAVVNWGRACIYSTNVPAMIAAGARASINVMWEEPWRQDRLRLLARRLRDAIRANGMRVSEGDSPIVPIVLHSEEAALHAATQMRDCGMLVVPIRPPSVPRGSSRLRVTLSCDHREWEVQELIAALGRLA
jgi:8-amino-7-oxononanoate synthase